MGDGDGALAHIADVRLLVPVQRRGNADGDKVHITDTGKVRGGGEHTALHQPLKVCLHDVADVILAAVDHIDLCLLDIEADGAKAVLRLIDRERQPDIAEAAHAHDQCLILNFLNQLFLYGHIHSTFI